VADYARGTAKFTEQQGTGRMLKAPSPQCLRKLQRQLDEMRHAFQPDGSRPFVKILAKTALAVPRVMVRNWKRRADRTFPVSILFHHLVTDRHHRLGISTEHFLRHVRFLQKHYDVVSLEEAIQMLESNAIHRPTVVLTFDDGYQDNFVNLRAVVEQTASPV